MINNYTTINVERKTIELTNDKTAFNTIRIYIIIYHTYPLLYCKEHIQMINNDTAINVETKTIELA